MEVLLDRIGTEIQIITRTKVRYSGVLSTLNKSNETIVLKEVRSHGTEGRPAPVQVKGTSQVYEYIIFKESNIETLKLEGNWTDPSKIPPKKEKKDKKNPTPRYPTHTKSEAQNPKVSPEGKPKHKTKEKPEPIKAKEKRSHPRRNNFLEQPNPKIPNEYYDFTKHNKQLKKLPVEKSEKHIYYNKNLSFFDSIT